MKTNPYISIVLFLVLFLFSACGTSGSDADNGSADGCRDDLAQKMTATLSDFLTDRDFSLYLETEDGGSYTYNKGAATLDTLYQSASTSKWVTAAIILRLVDQGAMSLDDHPQDYIAGWSITASDSLYDMTLSDLLSFTSGLAVEPPCMNAPTSNFATCVRRIAEVNAGNGKVPGEEFFYGPVHMQVAGLMAIRAAGVAGWQELFFRFQQETGLFADSTYDLPSVLNPRLAGGMHWQTTEYADFIRAFQFGGLLTEETKNRMLTDQITDAIITKTPPDEGINEAWHYGLGIWLECPSDVFDCETIDYYSSPGAFGAYPFINPENHFFGILAREGQLGSFAEGKAIYDAVADIAEQWATAPESCQ